MTLAGTTSTPRPFGIMGYHTPNIDRLAKEGALFTNSYAQQSCTAGRASFILSEHPFRTGLLIIGLPGSPQGIPGLGTYHCRSAEEPRLRHRAVGQEPFGRSGFAVADGSWVRRVPRQPLSLECRGRARKPITIRRTLSSRRQYGPRGVIHSWSGGKGGRKSRTPAR